MIAVSAKSTGVPYVKHVDAFNKKLKTLALDMSNRFKSDSMVWRAKERVMAAVSIDPLYIIGVVGAYLYTYRDQIYGKEAAFFIEQDYEKEFRESIDPTKVEAVRYIMPKIKSVWKTLDKATQERYQQIVIDLLDDYIEFVATQKLGA